MKNLIEKILFFWKKTKIIVVTDGDQETIKRFIARLLGSCFKIEREILFIDDIKKVDLSGRKYLIFNFDKEKVAELKGKTEAQILTFGFQFGADIQASDVIQNNGINFKVNYKGSIVPVWLASAPNISAEEGKARIYAALTAASVGIILNLNLVEISQGLTSVTK